MRMRTAIMTGILIIAFSVGIGLVITGLRESKTIEINQTESAETIHVDYNLTGENEEGISNLLQHYMESCDAVIARMYIPDTEMETPIVDDYYYFRRDLSGKYSTNGTPLVLTTDHFMKANQNAVIYGHRLYTGEDFGMLKNYLEQDYYDEHPDIKLETTAGETSWRIISVFTINVAKDSFSYIDYEDLSGSSTRDYFLNEIKNRTFVNTGDYTFHSGDQFITLSTCHYETDRNNGRLVVVAVRS